jgi:hypothetical protein
VLREEFKIFKFTAACLGAQCLAPLTIGLFKDCGLEEPFWQDFGLYFVILDQVILLDVESSRHHAGSSVHTQTCISVLRACDSEETHPQPGLHWD